MIQLLVNPHLTHKETGPQRSSYCSSFSWKVRESTEAAFFPQSADGSWREIKAQLLSKINSTEKPLHLKENGLHLSPTSGAARKLCCCCGPGKRGED